MPGHTKKHPTESIEIRFVGPASNRKRATAILETLGFVETGDTVSWKNVFPEYTGDQLPGVVLAGLRYREGLTQKELAGKTGIPQSNISEMERGIRTIGKERAKRLAAVLHSDYRLFL